MPNTHHVEPPPHHVDPPPHDPGKPDHPEPERPGEEHIFEPEGWGLDPLVTNPFRPGDNLASLKTHARDVFVLSEPVARNAAALPPEYQAFTQAVARIQEPFNNGIGAAGDQIKEGWDNQKELARSYQACLPDYWRDAVTFMQEHVGKIADKGKRNEYQGKLNDLFKNQDNLSEKLSGWDKERRNYPYDWDALSRLQNELSSELSGYLYRLGQIEAGYDKKNEGASYQNLDTAIVSGRYFFSALGFEIGRQGEELTKSATIYYGSASETAANALASTTHQNDVVMKLSDRASLKTWTNELALPKITFSDANPTRKKWNAEVIEPLTEKTNDWLEASKGDPDYDELKNATESLLVESFTQRDSLNNLDIKNIPDFIRNKARDALSLLSDVMANRLNELREKADLTQGKMLHDLIRDIRVLRENTTTEVLAREADQGISKFWSGKKDAALKKIESDFPDGGKELRRTLDLAFAEGLGGLLDKWSDEMKKAPKHSAKTLHDATWDVRFAVRRYRDSVKTILAAPAYAEHRLQLLASSDALQIAVSNRLRQAYQDGYYLF